MTHRQQVYYAVKTFVDDQSRIGNHKPTVQQVEKHLESKGFQMADRDMFADFYYANFQPGTCRALFRR